MLVQSAVQEIKSAVSNFVTGLVSDRRSGDIAPKIPSPTPSQMSSQVSDRRSCDIAPTIPSPTPSQMSSQSTQELGNSSHMLHQASHAVSHQTRDVEHIAELQQFVSAPVSLRKVGPLWHEGDIKMETDATLGEMSPREEHRKERIMFRNQIFGLNAVLARKCKTSTDITHLEETLYTMDRSFTRGVPRDVESFLNCILVMACENTTMYTSTLREEITLHIAENARKYQVK